MRLNAKDSAGFVLIAGTVAALALHSRETHTETHVSSVAEAGGASTSAQADLTVAFLDFNVVPMDGNGLMRRQVVIVRNGFISRMGPVGVVEVPAGARVVEGDGSGYLVPGLVDAHVHLDDAREDILPLFLANGVTTVFNLEGDARHVELRDRSRNPDFAGPTLFTSGPFIDENVVRTPADASGVVQSHVRAGYDFLKVYGALPEAAYAALVAAAREADLPVVGHAPRTLPLNSVLQHGQVSIVHAEELIYTGLPTLDESRLQQVAAELAARGIWLTPTMSQFANATEQWGSPEGLVRRAASPNARYLPASLRREWEASRVYTKRPARERERIEAMNGFHTPLVAAMHLAGVRMLTGTDSPLPGMVPGFSLHDELAALESAGVSREDVLTAATANAGRFIRETVDPNALFGTIEPGARADLVWVESDPRNDLGVLRSPVGVMVRGTWYDRAQLLTMLSLVSGVRIAEESRPE